MSQNESTTFLVTDAKNLTLTLKRRGGAKWPAANLKRYISGTECPIDLKPGCKFKFLSCLEVYLRKLINLDHEGALEGPFLPRVLQNLPRRIHFGVHLGVHDGPGGSSGPWYSSTMTKKCSKMF